MHYPVMSEWQVAHRWKISVKTLRRWRACGDGPRWNKLFNLVRYHQADVVEFERKGAQFWTTVLEDGERMPKVVTRLPKESEAPEDQPGGESFFLTVKDVLEATGLPGHWFIDPMARAAKRIPHVALVGNLRFSLEAIWAWETANSVVGKPKPPPVVEPPPTPPAHAPRWFELARAVNGEQFESRQPSE